MWPADTGTDWVTRTATKDVLDAPGRSVRSITPPFVTVRETVKFSGPEKTQEILAFWQTVTFMGPLSMKFEVEPLL